MKCPSCGFENESDVKFCGNCGTKLSETAVSMEEKLFCSSCGQENPPGSRFCQDCGVDLSTFVASSPPRSQAAPVKKRMAGWMWGVPGVLVLILAIGSILLFNRSKPLPSTQPAARPTQQTEVSCEDKLAFVTDVTVPDGTVLSPNEAFTKTWRLRNTGTCRWSTSYQLAFREGQQMSAPQTVALTKDVSPGQEIDISIDFTTPADTGSYKSFWRLQNANGDVVPIEGVAGNSIFVDIEVQAANDQQAGLPALPDILADAEILYQTGFDADPLWLKFGSVSVSNGRIIIDGSGSDDSGFLSSRSIQRVDQSILVMFQLKENSHCNLKLVAGEWTAVTWRGVGIDMNLTKNQMLTDLEYGEIPQYLGGKPLSGRLVIEPNRAYYFLIGISGNGDFDAFIWDASDPAANKTVTWRLGEDWQDLEWKFEPWCGDGEMSIHNYRELRLPMQDMQMP